jgi:hypothetical protein
VFKVGDFTLTNKEIIITIFKYSGIAVEVKKSEVFLEGP